MTKSAFEKFNAYLPYNQKDVLLMGEYRLLHALQWFPESTDSNLSKETNSGSETNPTFKEDVSRSADHGPRLSNEKTLNPEDNEDDLYEINDIMSGNGVDRMKTWIQRFRDQNVLVDKNRIIRCAISNGRNELVKYLVEEERASLQQEDKRGRSTIFYTVLTNNAAILKYIHDKMGTEIFLEEMSHQDSNKRTPWYYAVTNHLVANTEYLLTVGARPNDDVVSLINNISPVENRKRSKIQLALALFSVLIGHEAI